MVILFAVSAMVMLRAVFIIFLWFASLGFARADLSFVFNSSADIAVTAPGYSASGPLSLTLNFPPVAGQNLTVVKNTGTSFISGTFDGFPHGATVPLTFNGVTYHYIANYYGGNGRSFLLQWPNLQLVGWGYDNALQGSSTSGYGRSPSLLANEGGLAGKTIVATSPGGNHALALTADGKIYAWGNNGVGQLGDGTQVTKTVPVQVDASGALAGKTVVAISAGGSHSLALTSDGMMYAWGDNFYGRLGDGTTQKRLSPVAVNATGALAGKTVVAIEAGASHSMALTSDGLVFAWGYGFHGQLGNGSTVDQTTPVAVQTSGVLTGKTIIGISAGICHSAAVTVDGIIAAWGSNINGELGNNSTNPSSVPVQVIASGSLSGKVVTDVRAGGSFTLALTSDGQVHSWGGNGSGQLGIGSTTRSLLPALVGGSLSGSTVVTIAAGGAHSTALTSDGQPHVWGSDGNDELGNGVGTEVSATIPTLVPGLGPASGKRVAALFTRGSRSHVLRDPGQPQIRVNPLDLRANAGASARFTAAVSHPFPASVRWQMSPTGASGTFQDFTDEPSATSSTLTIAEISVIPDGAAFRAVFSNVSGQVTGNPAILRKAAWPAAFLSSSGPLSTVTAAAVAGILEPVLGFEPKPGVNLTLIQTTGPAPIIGRFTNMAHGAIVPLTYNGVTYRYVANYFGGNGRSLVLQWPAMGIAGWGSNFSGVIGDIGSTSQTALYNIPLAGPLAGKTIIDISGSGGHVLALTSDGRVFAWGSNSNGQLGNNSTNNSPLPVAVDTSGALSGQTVVAIAAGDNLSYAITSDGRLFTWGKRRTANGVTLNSLAPVEFGIGGLLAGKTVVAVSTGGSFDLALTSEGEIYGWGQNTSSQLSGTNTAYRQDPVLLDSGAIGTTPVIAIAAGTDHCLALDLDGRVFSWGAARYGALGINSGPTDFSVKSPVAVLTDGVLAGKTISSIAARNGMSMVEATDGTVYSWGRNWNGELGDGTTTERAVPVAVVSSGALAGKAVMEIRLGSEHCLALTTDGKIFSWGDNGFGQLGSGTWNDSLVPVAVTSEGVMKDRNTARMATGWQSSLALIGLGAPTITRHPLDLMAAVGQTATFTAEAEDPFSFSIQWQCSPNGPSGPFTDIAGNTNTLSLPEITSAQDGWAYRAVFISAAGERATTPAVLRTAEWSATLSPTSLVPFKSARVRASGTFLLSMGSAPVTGKNITLIENTGPEFISGSFDNLPQAGLINLTHNGIIYPFVVNYYGGNGRSLVLQWPWTAIAGWGSTIATSPENIAPRPALATKTITAVKAGSSHQIVLTADGKVFGWGSNNQGQLGNTLTTASTTPVSLKDDAALAGKTIAVIASGTSHNLALTTNGELFSWGNNTSGKLGDGSTTNRTQPVAVVASGALAGKTITAIAAGDQHSLALSAEGKVFAWGSNSFDQLGTEAWQDSSVPVAVDTRGALRGKTITAIAAGYGHSLVLTSDGEVFSWGSNGNGKLGNGTNIDPRTPVKVDASGALAGKRVIAIAAGEDHSIALTADGLVFAWGDNTYGQLGDNSGSTHSAVPVPVFTNGVLAGKIVAGISAGIDHCLAITADGITVSWGRNLSGQLGNGGTVNSPVPVLVASNGILSGAAIHSITAFGDRSFALLGVAGSPFITTVPQGRSFLLGAGAGSVSTSFDAAALDPLPISLQWQEAGPSGDFSNITGNPSANSPTLQITELTSAMNGRRYRAVFSNAGGTTVSPSSTLNVIFAESPVVLQNARDNLFAMDSVTLVGSLNVSLGFAPTPGDRLTLVRNTGSSHLTGSFANLVQGAVVPLEFGGRTHSFIVDYYGGNGRSLVLHWASALAAGWGDSSAGQVGSDGNFSVNRTPLAVTSDGVTAGETLVKLAAGTSHSLALAASGRIFAWGDNTSGRLGNSSTTPSRVPVRVTATGLLNGKTVVNIAAGGSHSLALTSDGQVAAWGSNSSGQLGSGGSSSGSAAPVATSRSGVLADKLVTDIAAGQSHSVALLSDGTMVAWGANSSGQLGTGNTTLSALPAAVLSNGALAGIRFVAIAAGANHTLALSSDGRVFSWGSNQFGQLGRGSGNSSTPETISGGGMLGGQPVIAIAAGASHSLALAANGRVFAWGLGSSGQLGIGNTFPYLPPTAVSTSGVLSGKSIVAIAAGANHSLAIDSNGSGYAWGSNSSGQLGNNSFSSSASSPVSLSTQGAIGSRALTSIAAGGSHSLAIAGRGTAPTVSQAPTSLTVTAGNTVTFTAAGNGYPAPTVRWQRSTTGPTGTFTDLAGQTTNTLQLSNVTTSQSSHAFRAVFTNLEASANSTAAVLTVQPTLATYLTSRGLPANSPPLGDPFQTGVPHLLAYAFDVNPAAPDRTRLPTVTIAGGRLRISYVRWKNAADLQYTVEACHDLSDWQSGPGITETISVTPIDNSRETVVEQEILPGLPTSRFLRVRVVLTTP